MRIAIITDAWRPQVNGVVTTLSRTAETLESLGHRVQVTHPGSFRTFPCPTYPEIRLAWRPYSGMRRQLDAFAPEHIHIATEGPLGLAGRRYCRRHGLQFTTSYHTQFPQYVKKRLPIPLAASFAFLRWFHGAASGTMVATASQRRELTDRGFGNLRPWTRGVDTELFHPGNPANIPDERPIWIYVGRVSIEKSIEDFLALEVPGTKYVVGDGPMRAELERRYPAARFTGYRFGTDLANLMGAADVFVFPSRTDTFGIVMLDAMACGLPVAAYPVVGPVDLVEHGKTGYLSEDLREAALAALSLDKQACIDFARRHSWRHATEQFVENLVAART